MAIREDTQAYFDRMCELLELDQSFCGQKDADGKQYDPRNPSMQRHLRRAITRIALDRGDRCGQLAQLRREHGDELGALTAEGLQGAWYDFAGSVPA